MNAEDRSPLLRLAEALGDAVPVDWEEERRGAPAADSTIQRLQELAAIAAAHSELRCEEEPVADAPALFHWGHLRTLECLGQGSFGEVYRAHDTLLDREVALKLRRAGPTQTAGGNRRFIEEARRLARVRHGNVLEVYGADLHDSRIGLWTELVRGRTLEQWLDEEGTRGPQEVTAIGLDLCRALAAVHAAGLVHGDVKTSNVLRETGGRLVLSDFGSSREVALMTGAATASPATAAPEVLRGEAPQPVSDLYSLGVLLYRMLSGCYPVEGNDVVAITAQHARGARRPLCDLRPDLPSGLVWVIERALDPDPQRRFATAGAMEQALAATLTGDAALGRPASPVRSARRGTAAFWLIAAAMAIVAVAAALLVRTMLPRETAVPDTARTEAIETAPGSPPLTVPRQPAAAAEPEREGPPAAASQGSKARTSRPALPAVNATLYLAGFGESQQLQSGSKVAPGDRLFLELETGEELYLYVVNGDSTGKVFQLFPLAGVKPDNPLPAGTHRLPGLLGGVAQDWQVTSAGGTETFVIAAARKPLSRLERELASLTAAGSSEGTTLRGIGGLVAASPESNPRLRSLVDLLDRSKQESSGVWLVRYELLNPAP